LNPAARLTFSYIRLRVLGKILWFFWLSHYDWEKWEISLTSYNVRNRWSANCVYHRLARVFRHLRMVRVYVKVHPRDFRL
jgi:hypothetical protein